MSELKKLEEQLRELQIAKIRNTIVGKSYFEQMQDEVKLLKRIKKLTPADAEKPVSYLPWSEKDVKWLRDFYEELTVKQLANQLARTTRQVEYRMELLGLKKG